MKNKVYVLESMNGRILTSCNSRRQAVKLAKKYGSGYCYWRKINNLKRHFAFMWCN